MPIVTRIMAAGLSPFAAANIQGDWTGSITAAGTTATDATVLNSAMNYVSTTSASTGVKLPAVNIGDSVIVINGGLQTLSVYGQTGESFTNGSANAAFSVATLKSCVFYKVTATLWMVNLSA